MEAKVYNQIGKEVSSVKLPEKIFGVTWNEDLVHQVANSMMGNARTPIAHAKMRGEVAGSGIKPWRQKGTGRARHGSRRSPIWIGGGTTHGPRNDRDFSTKINKKMKNKALFTVLSRKFKDGEVLFVDDLVLKVAKTKEAKNVITALSKISGLGALSRRKNAVFLALAEKQEATAKSFNNFSNMEIGQIKDLNVLDILQYRYLIVANPEKSITSLEARLK